MKIAKHYGLDTFGNIDVLKEFVLPIDFSNSNDVLVKIERIGVNPVDALIRSGSLSNTPKPDSPVILGKELQGEIIGMNVSLPNLKLGDKVIALTQGGAYAEAIALNHTQIYKIPDSMPLDLAAGFSSAGITAYWAINGGFYDIKPSDTVALISPSGTLGSIILQLLKQKTNNIIAVSSQSKKDGVLALGAQTFIDYEDNQLLKEYQSKVDYIIDASLFQSGEHLGIVLAKENATYLSMGRFPDYNGPKTIHYKFFYRTPEMKSEIAIEALMNHYLNYGLSLEVGHKFPLSLQGVKDAHTLLNSTHKSGKILLQSTEF